MCADAWGTAGESRGACGCDHVCVFVCARVWLQLASGIRRALATGPRLSAAAGGGGGPGPVGSGAAGAGLASGAGPESFSEPFVVSVKR